jgi:hypothetical protein
MGGKGEGMRVGVLGIVGVASEGKPVIRQARVMGMAIAIKRSTDRKMERSEFDFAFIWIT